MVLEEYYDKFFNNRKFLESPLNKISISRREFERLKKRAGKAELLEEEIVRIKAEKERIYKEMIGLKNDARKFQEYKVQAEEYLNSLLRVQADFENYRKRNDRENQRYQLQVKEKIFEKMIKHYDDLKRTLEVFNALENGESVKKGFEMVMTNFEKLLKDECIEPMNCEGQIFDPYKHEALLVENNDKLPENTIIEELSNGYYLNNKVLRPARVKISKKSKLKNSS